jgi:hypothetical protein
MTRATSARRRSRSTGKVGRPPLIHDHEVVESLLDAVRGSNWLVTAAALAGVSKSTVDNWLARGRAARALDEEGRDVPADQLVYLSFADDFDRAEAEAEANIVGNITEQTSRSAQAAMGFLKMRWPQRWRDQPSQVEMTGRDPWMPLSPVLAAMSDGELNAVIAELEAKLAAPDGEDG